MASSIMSPITYYLALYFILGFIFTIYRISVEGIISVGHTELLSRGGLPFLVIVAFLHFCSPMAADRLRCD